MLGPFGLGPKMTMCRRALPAARALAARGHSVTIVLPPWQTPEAAGRAYDDAVRGVRIENVSLRGLRVPVVGHALVALRMARRTAALRPDVVHAFKPKAYSGLAATILLAARRLRLVRPFRLVVDTDDWEGPGGWNDLERYSFAQRAVFRRQERHGLTRADHVTVASRALEALVWAMGVPPARVTYLPNAIDDRAGRGDGGGTDDGAALLRDDARTSSASEPASTATNSTARTATRPPTLLLYTRFFEFTLDRPLDVLALVRRRFPDVRLVVAGTGLYGEERRFVDLATGRGLADAVDCLGWLPPDGAAAVFAAADVALYPFDDTLINRTKSPFKLLELMAAGLPVVADAVGELREVIVDSVSGALVPPADAAAMAAAVTTLLEDGARRARIAQGARERIAAGYGWSGRVGRLEDAYSAGRPADEPRHRP